MTLWIAVCFAQGQDAPAGQQEAADRAFAEGFKYYIWYEGTEPLTATAASTQAVETPQFRIPARTLTMIPSIKFNYLAKPGKPAPFMIRSRVTAFEKVGGQAFGWSTVSEKIEVKAQSGVESTMLIVEALLSGEGYFELHLIEPSKNKKAEPKPLSNTIRIRVVCEEKPPDRSPAQ
ncbi:MAG TPA: hypothetical protein PLZ95_22610 [Bryobacteraceae bacterium]|nr:hypothetical protein [Bryobacteraceae bacterium]